MIDTEGVLLVFTRSPVAGETKTRLIPVLGREGAARLHRLLLRNTLKLALQSQFCNVELWCTPTTDHPFLQECSHKFAVKLCCQEGEDLGQCMQNALASTLSRYAFAVIVGSDCPVLTTDLLNRAYLQLQSGMDALLGPSEDGGYYLFGLRRYTPPLFAGIDWGGNNVVEMTYKQLAALGWHWNALDTLWDVDRPEDMEKLKTLWPDLVQEFYAKIA